MDGITSTGQGVRSTGDDTQGTSGTGASGTAASTTTTSSGQPEKTAYVFGDTSGKSEAPTPEEASPDAHTPYLQKPKEKDENDLLSDDVFNQDTSAEGYLERFLEAQEAADTPPPGSPAALRREELAKIKVEDPEILALAEKSGLSPGQVLEDVQVSAQLVFKDLIKDLPDEDQKKLEFARYHPGAAKNLSPALQAKLKEINANVTTTIGRDAGFSSDWPGIALDSSEINQYDRDLSSDASSTFQDALDEAVDSGRITDDQSKKLKTMYFMKGAFTEDPILQSLYQNIYSSVQTQMEQTYGFDSTFEIPLNTDYYPAVANGDYATKVRDMLANAQPPLTKDEQEMIKGMLGNPPVTPSFPTRTYEEGRSAKTQLIKLSGIANHIRTTCTAAVIAELGLDPTWMPTIGKIDNPIINNDGFKKATDALDMMKEMINKMGPEIDKLPPDVQADYRNYLKATLAAIAELQQFLYSIEGATTSITSKFSQSSADASSASIGIMKKAWRKAERAMHKAKNSIMGKIAHGMAPLNKVNGWLGKVMTIAVSVAIAVLLMATAVATVNPLIVTAAIYVSVLIVSAAVAITVDQAVAEQTGEPSITEQSMSYINKAMNKLTGENCGWVVTGCLSLLLSGGNPLLAASLLTGDSGTITNMVQCMGGSKADGEIASMVLNAVTQIVVAVAMTFMGNPAGLGGTISKIASATISIGDRAICTVGTAAKGAMAVATIGMGALQTASGGYQANLSFAQADVTKIKALSEAQTELIKELTKAVQKAIENLMAFLSQTGEQIVDINQLASGLQQSYKNMVTNLFGA